MRQNLVHRVDLQLRQWISSQLQDKNVLSNGGSKAQLALHLNQRRKNYLDFIKHSPNEVENFRDDVIDQVVVSLVQRFQLLQE